MRTARRAPAGAGRDGERRFAELGTYRAPQGRELGGNPCGERRFAELDAYRGIAALMIVAFHAHGFLAYDARHGRLFDDGTLSQRLFDQLSGSVAWFFVLSGFLLFLPFARAAVEQGGAPSARGFLVRRAIRILPLYYFAVLFVWTVLYTGGREQLLALVEHLTFTQIFDPAHLFWTIGPAWSLAVEALFYLSLAALGPLAYRACGRLRTPAARVALLVGVVALLGAASVGYKWWAWRIARVPLADRPVYSGLLAELDTFALGMLIAVVAAAGRRPLMAGATPALLRLLGGAALLLAVLLRCTSTAGDIYFHTLFGGGFALVLASTVLAPRSAPWERLLANRLLLFLGLISYSVYLWHEFLLWVLAHLRLLVGGGAAGFPLRMAAVLALATAVASASYWAIERPAMRLRRLFTPDGRLAGRGRGPGAEPAASDGLARATPAPGLLGNDRAS